MPPPILATKLYIPPQRPGVILRPRLVDRLNEGLYRKLTLISAPAGFGKTTIAREWLAASGRPAAWLSLDEGDSDPARFLTYLVAALQSVAGKGTAANLGASALAALQAPQPAPFESILTALVNDIANLPDALILVLDDYHLVDSLPVDQALAFLLEHLPPHMHLVVATREDPNLPLARLRARGHLTELRVADLRFTSGEATDFLNQAMGLNLSPEDIAALENRTEGWIAGLQLAALALQGARSGAEPQDASTLIQSFSGSHRFVLDYLLEEVLHQQPESVQTFLLRTSILDRLCGSLCEAVVGEALPSGQETLETLERTNLFIVPLDDQRLWYRYHHLFGDLLRQRLLQRTLLAGEDGWSVPELHRRASRWYEDHDLDIDAFQHAAAAEDIERAARLLIGKGMPLHFRGAVGPVLRWLQSLPNDELDARPVLWVMYASVLSMSGRLTEVEPKLQAAESALQAQLHGREPDAQARNLTGHIAAIRALLAAAQGQIEAIIDQSQRALEYLHPDNLAVRTATIWKLGIAYHLQGQRAAASQAYQEAMRISQASGNTIIFLSASSGLGQVQEADLRLNQAAETYRRILDLPGEQQQLSAATAHLGLARICYQWNDLVAAEEHARRCLQLAQMIEGLDISVEIRLLLARLRLAQADTAGAAALLAEAGQAAHQYNFVTQTPQIAAVQVLVYLQQGDLTAASQVVQAHHLPISQARVYLAQADPAAALAVLAPFRQQMDARAWHDQRLQAMIVQALALQAQGEQEPALQQLAEALALAEPGGLIRIFINEGEPMAQLLSAAARRGVRPTYTAKLLSAFAAQQPAVASKPDSPVNQPLIEPLSDRELEVLKLVAEGLSNREIGERLYLAESTVKGHNRNIYGKLQVQRRTEAVARAQELGLL